MTVFVSNTSLWRELEARVHSARHVDAAIAYFGSGGAKTLPLRKRSRLVVDMSIRTVRAGGTDPYEVEKLIRRGVEVFSRPNLHAKVVIADNTLLCGSANVSRHAREVLDEAAVLTTDSAAVRRAKEFIDRLCNEPVSPEYLAKCKLEYRPPRFLGSRGNAEKHNHPVDRAKLWLVNLSEYEVPAAEQTRFKKGADIASKKIRDTARWVLDDFHWSDKPKMADDLELGDWVLMIMTHKDKSVIAYPPGRFLYLDHYRRGEGNKERWVFHVEVRKRGERMNWEKFQQSVRSIPQLAKLSSPRTMPVRDVDSADLVLDLWTPGGRIAKR